MITLAITGGMGCGKSAACQAMSRAGADSVLSADAMVREMLERDDAIKREIAGLLGEEVFSSGKPDRSKIAAKVFADGELLKKYEGIIYRNLIGKIISPEFSPVSEGAFCSGERLVCVEVPLLFEKRLEKFFDISLAVFCSEELRFKRLAGRGMSLPDIKARDAFQLPPAKKVELADVVLFNEGGVDFLERQAAAVVHLLKSNGRRYKRTPARR